MIDKDVQKVGVIGTGNLGRAIGVRLSQAGYDVLFGARRPDEAALAADLTGGRARPGSNEDAVDHGDILFWMIRETRPEVVLRQPKLLAGKIVVDVNNRPFKGEADDGPWFQTSLGEELKANLPGSRYVKALTCTSMYTFDTPIEELRAADAQTFVAGDDEDAKRIVAGLLAETGVRAIDIGSGPVALRAAEAFGNIMRLMIGNGTLPPNGQLAVTTLPATRMNSIGGHRPSGYIRGSVHEGKLPER